jgi:MoaA/NifB/PqqE/SkfB family radical SAM enzyme
MEEQEIGAHLSTKIMELMEKASTLFDEADERGPEWLQDIMIDQAEAASRREHFEREGVHVPAFMIISVTRKCNLNCKGCYAKELHSKGEFEMDDELLGSVISQANELGISIILTAGGEPLLRPDLIDIIKKNPKIIFPLFTNGLLLTD